MSANPNRGGLTVRYLKALAACGGDPNLVASFAAGQNWRGDEEQIVETAKTAIAASGTSVIPLPTPASFDFAEFIRPMTILGRLSGLRRVPSRVRTITATAGSGAAWVGESQPIPISRVTLNGDALEPLKVAAVLVTTLELLRSSAPGAQSILSRDLAAAAVAAMDQAFIDPANAGTANVKPAAITNGVTPLTSTGATLSAIDSDLERMIVAIETAGSDLTFATWVLRPRTALFLSRLRGTGGALAFPEMTVRGGTLLGLPAITSSHVPVEAGSPGDGDTSITLLDASQVLVADDGGGDFEIATSATLQMSDAPTNDSSTPTATSMVSMFQTDSAAIKTTRHANWQRVRDGAAQVLATVQY